jgi:cell division cycle 2-like protein
MKSKWESSDDDGNEGTTERERKRLAKKAKKEAKKEVRKREETTAANGAGDIGPQRPEPAAEKMSEEEMNRLYFQATDEPRPPGEEEEDVQLRQPAPGPYLVGCRHVDEYEKLNRIDEGTYGVVYRAKDPLTGDIVALKRIKFDKSEDGFPITSLREISCLLDLRHPHIVGVREVVMSDSDEG